MFELRKVYLIVGFFVLCQSTEANAAPKKNSTARIVGGYLTTIDTAPYAVQLWYLGSYICCGSLVSEWFVLTAAHCTDERSAANFRVRGGTSYFTEGVVRKVKKMIVPQEYTYYDFHSDIALLELANTMKGANIKPIPLSTAPIKANVLVKASGWGNITPKLSSQLRSVQLKVLTAAQCKETAGGKITNTMFCAAAPGKDTCQGDSGGPVVFNGTLVGITSWGKGCARPEHPGVYTGTYSRRNFVRNNMKR